MADRQETLGVDPPRSGAVVSACGRYRYHLWRQWAEGPAALWVMLNPSTADASADDPTIRKCVGFARRWGCGRIDVVNLFALRATDPHELTRVQDPVGPRNAAALRDVLRGRGESLLIAAWGAGSRVRGKALESRARRFRDEVGHLRFFCLGTTKGGQPRHPLMPAYSTPLQRWPVAS